MHSVAGLFTGCLFTFLFLYIIIDLFSHLEVILKQQLSFEFLNRYYAANIPIIFVQVVPIACLLATLYTFAKLNRDNEVIAMRSSGLSIFQITRPVIIFSILISTMVFWINDRIVPPSSALAQKVKEQMDTGGKDLNTKAPEVIRNLSMYGSKNRLYFANSFYPSTKTMEGIIILEHDERQNIIRKIMANRGVFEDDTWKFYHCITYSFDETGQIQEPLFLEEQIMSITETPEDFLHQGQRPDFMTAAQLDTYILKLARSGAESVIRNLKVDLYQRFALPLTSVVITLLGIPFAFMIRKRATGLSSLGVSLIVGFLYYVLNAVSIALGKAGILSPFLSVFLSHIVVLVFSLYFITTVP
ncbi:MAG: LptF/LptG family permease [Candidatus Omnitrophota bacterium]|jgi:lipopolysaccharide export system permease protein